MGAPGAQTTTLADQLRVWLSWKKRRQPFLHFYKEKQRGCPLLDAPFLFYPTRGGKVLDRSGAKGDFKGSSGKDYENHGLNQSHKLQFRLNFST